MSPRGPKQRGHQITSVTECVDTVMLGMEKQDMEHYILREFDIWWLKH
jgi:hypothetical protein